MTLFGFICCQKCRRVRRAFWSDEFGYDDHYCVECRAAIISDATIHAMETAARFWTEMLVLQYKAGLRRINAEHRAACRKLAFDRGKLYYEMGMLEEASKAFDEAVQL